MESAGLGSREVASAALRVAISANRDEEKALQQEFANQGIYTAGVDFGGEFINSVTKIIERSIVAAKREGIIQDLHVEEGAVAGSYVTDGQIQRGSQVRLLRDSVVIFEGKMASLKRFKDDVREVNSGYECGITLDGYNDIKEGDVIEAFKMEEIPVV